MTLPTSPAVVFIERDNTTYVPNIESSVVGIVGFADKGPTNKAVLITSQQNLLNTFGNPRNLIPGQGLEGALEILETTDQVYFVRAEGATATDASASVSIGFCPAFCVSNVNSFGTTNSLKINAQVYSNGTALLTTPASLTITSGATSFWGAASAGVGVGAFSTDYISVAQDSAGNVFLYTPLAGSSITLSAAAFSGPSLNVATPALYRVSAAGTFTVAAAAGLTYGGTVSSTSLPFISKYPGQGYNLGTKTNGQVTGCSVEIRQSYADFFNVDINDRGVAEESYFTTFLSNDYNLSTLIPTTEDSTNNSEIVKTSTTLAFTESNFANVFGVSVGGLEGSTATSFTTATPRFVKPVVGTYSLTGGSNGTDSGSGDTASLITGIGYLNDDSLNISIGIVPGVATQSVQNTLVTLAETSQNFVAVVAPPVGLSVQGAVDWMNGRNTRTASINSSYAAVAWPWVKVFNTFDQVDQWYDPAIFVARQMAFTDATAETWFAPAGYRRGRLTKPFDTEVVVNQGDRNTLYDSNINPIAKFVPEGITIFGQKTAQRLPTSLDRINVRRLMIYLRKVLLSVGRPFLMEPDDEFTWNEIKETLNPFLNDVASRRGIEDDFQVICDKTTNTPARIARNEIWCQIKIRPIRAAEWIVFDVNLSNQTASLNG